MIVRYNCVKNKYYQLVVSSNDDVADTLLIYLHGNNIEYSDKQLIIFIFYTIIPNYHQSLAMIFENFFILTQWSLVPLWYTIKIIMMLDKNRHGI